MQTYETLFITNPTLTEDEEKSTVEAMLQIVAEGGGSLVTNDRMGRRHLAYPINKHNDGVYIRFLYDAESEVPKELERRLRLSDQVLRAMTVRLDRGWAVQAKEQAVRDAAAKVEAERLEQERAIEEKARLEREAAEAAANPPPPPAEADTAAPAAEAATAKAEGEPTASAEPAAPAKPAEDEA